MCDTNIKTFSNVEIYNIFNDNIHEKNTSILETIKPKLKLEESHQNDRISDELLDCEYVFKKMFTKEELILQLDRPRIQVCKS